jgi:DNA primase
MGCTMSDQQADLLSRRFTQAIVMLDGDEAGRHGSAAIAGRPKSTVKTVANSPSAAPENRGRITRSAWPKRTRESAKANQKAARSTMIVIILARTFDSRVTRSGAAGRSPN